MLQLGPAAGLGHPHPDAESPSLLARHPLSLAIAGLLLAVAGLLIHQARLNRRRRAEVARLERQDQTLARRDARIAQLSAILRNSAVGIGMVDGQRRLIEANDRMAEMFGYDSPGQMIGLSVRDLHVSEESFLAFGKSHFTPLAEGDQIHIEYPLRRRDGSPMWCLLSGRAIDDGRPADLSQGVTWVIDDVSEQKALRERLLAATQAAEAANVAKSEFLANMSHELRTPLNAIIGFSEAMSLKALGELPEAYRDYAALIHRSGHHLLEVINQILDLAKIEAGRLELERSVEDMRGLIDDVLAVLTDWAADKGLSLDNRTAALHTLVVDRTRVKQALFNVIGNAIKFTEHGGVVITNRCGGGWHRIVISDTGFGMTPEEQEIALKPFGQVHGHSLNRRHQGTGLGLSISQEILRLHGGELRIDSTPGEGTTVTLAFPEDALNPGHPARPDG
ncbi:PAS domain-containing sensor histidine kinase [Roseospirillum parvum]|uniref:PAS domain-containing sensor histidine kinase n=1 Tax=Roseospirillum parvum TaxID=83401 RepID=UPI000B891640|nr:ATP-binding protein [Roseospirillum parvum]